MMRSIERIPKGLKFGFHSSDGASVLYNNKIVVFVYYYDSFVPERIYSCSRKEFLKEYPQLRTLLPL